MATLLRTGLAMATMPFAVAAGRARPGVRILMYHRVLPTTRFDQLTVTPERFAAQMAWLAERFEVVSLDQTVAGLRRTGQILPPNPKPARPRVALTFDDGYLDNLTHAVPVLQRLRLPATIFVTSAFTDQAMRHPRYPQEAGRMHLDWSEVRILCGLPGITIGSHTVSHPYLQRLSDREARAEIIDSRRQIEDRIGKSVDYFCYPSGDVGPREAALAHSAGYAASVTVQPGLNRPGADLQTLRRTEVTQNDGAVDFALKLRGAFDPVHAVLHWRRRRRFGAAAGA